MESNPSKKIRLDDILKNFDKNELRIINETQDDSINWDDPEIIDILNPDIPIDSCDLDNINIDNLVTTEIIMSKLISIIISKQLLKTTIKFVLYFYFYFYQKSFFKFLEFDIILLQ